MSSYVYTGRILEMGNYFIHIEDILLHTKIALALGINCIIKSNFLQLKMMSCSPLILSLKYNVYTPLALCTIW